MNCKHCGKENIPKNMRGYCQSCYKYFIRDKKEVYPLPAFGEMTFAPNGNCICPICGMAYRKLGLHFWNSHNMTAKEAYKLVGWDITPHASNKEYQIIMRDKLQEKCVTENLIKKGIKTRFKKSGPGRPKEKMSQMTLNRIREMHRLSRQSK